MGRLMLSVLCGALLFAGTASAKDWADANGSAFAKGEKILGAGVCIADFGAYCTFDYAVHDAISAGGGLGFNYSLSKWDPLGIPIAVRGAFHPFNLALLADKIKIRDKLDAYVGLSLGWRIGFGHPSWISLPIGYPEGLIIREIVGARWYFTPKICVFAEEGTGFGIINAGVGFKL
jgi:hypothetical protein